MYVSKSDKVRAHVRAGEYDKALAITKGFRLGLTKNQSDAMIRAHECMHHPAFYRQIGINPEEAVSAGIKTLRELYS